MLKVAIFTVAGLGLLILAFWWYFSRPGEALNPHDWMSDHVDFGHCVKSPTETFPQVTVGAQIFTDPRCVEHFYPLLFQINNKRTGIIEWKFDICLKHGELRPMK